MRLFLTVFFFLLSVSAFARNGRESEVFNREWMYRRGDVAGAEQCDYDDSRWEAVGLPHSFSMPYFMSKDFFVGYGWYRKHLKLTKTDLQRRLSLEFDGVFQEAEVFVNGQLAGSHVGGYTGFSIDITPYVVCGDNVLAVRVNNCWQATVAPRGGEHVFSGGIYRNVRLVKKQPLHISWNSVIVTAPNLEATYGERSRVEVRAEVVNTLSKPADVTVKIIVRDSESRIVGEGKLQQTLAAENKTSFDIKTTEIGRPSLWSPESPSLYTVETQVWKNRKLLDREVTTFGFRWFEWSADKGFFLNGKHYYLRGANVHQDQAGWGDAVTDAAAQRDVKMMKEAGFNMIRGSHYPHSPAFVEACDREGILFWSEAPFWGTAGPKEDGVWTASAYPVNPADTAAFEASALRQLEEMIYIHRNHPSVFVWSMCNEPFFTDGRTLPGVKRLLRRMVDKAHALDPTRKAAIGGAQRPLGDDRIDHIGDIAGYNGDGANIADFQMPGVPSVVSEYGSTTADRPGKYTPGWGDLNRDEGWRGREWRSGHAIWCGFDHGSLFGDDLGKMGIVDYFRLPKRSWYWYRNEYARIVPPEWPQEGHATRLRLTASKAKGIVADGTDDVQLVVAVLDSAGHELSNSPVVEMRVISGPGEFPTGKVIRFAPGSDIRIQDGKAAIAIRSYFAGKSIIEATSEGLQLARLELEFVGAPSYVVGESRETVNRPYIKYVKEETGALQTYGLNNPTFASSAAEGHSAGFAADGNDATYWQPDSEDAIATWMLDTERGLDIHSLSLFFAETSSCHYVLEISADNINWQQIYEASSIDSKTLNLVLPTSQKMRFLRFTVRGGTVKLAEVQVTGRISITGRSH